MATPLDREEYLEEMERRLERVQTDIKGLGEHMGQSPEAAQAEVEKVKRSLTEKHEQVLKDIEDAKQKGVGAWAEMKVGLEEAWGELNEAAQRAKEKLQESK